MRKNSQAKKRHQKNKQQRQIRRQSGVAALQRNASRPAAHDRSPSLALREAKLAVIEQFDGMAGLRNALAHIGRERREWAGIPMPLEGLPMTVEPTYPKAAELMAMGRKPEDGETLAEAGTKVRNQFWSWRYRCNICVYEQDGKITFAPLHTNPLMLQLHTLEAADAWGIEQESNAVHTLAGLLRHRQFKQYMLTGMFLETSKRSGVSYIFRRLRPTVAFTMNGCGNGAAFNSDGGLQMRILCALCLHPIAYYVGSWSGAMTPTDDVIAHLMLMRGDEPMFWRRANQHPAWAKEAGIH